MSDYVDNMDYSDAYTEYAEETDPFETLPEDTSSRRILVVLLDVSGSMGPQSGRPPGQQPIDELNRAFENFLKGSGVQKSQFGLNGEIAMAAFYSDAQEKVVWIPLGNKVHERSKFYWVRYLPREFQDALYAGGRTPLGHAVGEGLDLIEERIAEIKNEGHTLGSRPALVVLTDGRPTDPDAVERVIPRVHELEKAGKLVLWIACMRDADAKTLEPMANKGNIIDLGNKSIDSFIRLMSLSIDVAADGSGRTAADIYRQLIGKWGD